MHGFNDTSVNWTDSASVGSHYDAMIKRYLKKKNQTDFSKFEFALHGYNPVFSKWEYPDIPKPCVNRIKKLSNNIEGNHFNIRKKGFESLRFVEGLMNW